MGAGTLRFYRGLDHQAQRGEYPFELAETLAYAFGRSSAEEWIEYSPRLSCSIREFSPGAARRCSASTALTTAFFRLPTCIYCWHGDPKTARFFPGGHMGGGGAQPVILAWLKENLS